MRKKHNLIIKPDLRKAMLRFIAFILKTSLEQTPEQPKQEIEQKKKGTKKCKSCGRKSRTGFYKWRYCGTNRECFNAQQRERLRDPKARERHNAQQRQRQRVRYHSDPAYRTKVNKKRSEWQRRNK